MKLDTSPESSALHERLRRVLRAPGGAMPRAERSAGSEAGSQALPSIDAAHPAGLAAALPREAGDPTDLREGRNARGPWCAREVAFAVEHVHGAWRVAEVFGAEGRALSLVALDPSLQAFDAREAVFLDIETNGLGGGAGCLAFLVALARFEAGALVLWQGFLRHPGEESALLDECARRIRQARCVVSFFGKSFDRHRLEDKMRMHGIDAPFRERAHLDLYWPCRRLYGPSLPNVRLATVERELLGVQRERDLPGAFAPAAWMDYQSGRGHRLDAVFRHNRDDVLSLVTLTAHLGSSLREARLDGSALEGDQSSRARGLFELYRRRKQRDEASLWRERARQRGAAM